MPLASRRSSPSRPLTWARVVALSALVVLGSAIAIGAWWISSSQTRMASYPVRGSLDAITIDVGNADATIVGGGSRGDVIVSRTDRYAFDHPARAERAVVDGVLRLRSRCPSAVLGSCSASYRLVVPNNVTVDVRTGSGDVRFDRYQGSARIETVTGNVEVEGFCGFGLRVRAESGDVHARAACAPESLDLRSRTGNVTALVPPGRYRVDVDTDRGDSVVKGVTAAEDAPFQIQALSGSGDVRVESRR